MYNNLITCQLDASLWTGSQWTMRLEKETKSRARTKTGIGGGRGTAQARRGEAVSGCVQSGRNEAVASLSGRQSSAPTPLPHHLQQQRWPLPRPRPPPPPQLRSRRWLRRTTSPRLSPADASEPPAAAPKARSGCCSSPLCSAQGARPERGRLAPPRGRRASMLRALPSLADAAPAASTAAAAEWSGPRRPFPRPGRARWPAPAPTPFRARGG